MSEIYQDSIIVLDLDKNLRKSSIDTTKYGRYKQQRRCI